MSEQIFSLLIDRLPASADVIEALEQVDIETTIDVPSVLRMRFGIERTARGDWTILKDDRFVPSTPIALRVGLGNGLPRAVFNGVITQTELHCGSESGESALEVTALDETFVLALSDQVRAWPNASDSSIATQILTRNKIVPRVDTTAPGLMSTDGTTIQRESDSAFLRRLAARQGFDFYIQPEPTTGVSIGRFGARSLAGKPAAVLNVLMGAETNVDQFRVRYDMSRPTTATMSAIDLRTKATQSGSATTSRATSLGKSGTLAAGSSPGAAFPARTGLMSSNELRSYAQAVADRSTWAVTASGTLAADVDLLSPGSLVSVRGAGKNFSGMYFLTRVGHTLQRGSRTQRFEASRNALGLIGSEDFLDES